MGAWRNSGELTKRSYAVVKEHKGLNAYPVRAAVYGGIASVVCMVPGVALMAAESTAGLVAGLLLVVLGAVLAACLSTYQMAGLVADADRVLAGGEPDRGAAMAQVAQRRGGLTGWAILNLTVGTLLRALAGDGGSGGGGAGMVLAIARLLLAGALAVAWALVTFFALPVIVFEGVGAIEAVKRSGHLVKQRWGTAVAGGVRIGARFGLMLTLPGVLLVVGGVFLAASMDNPAGWTLAGIVVVVGLALVIVGSVLAATCRNVFGVALYRYAAEGVAVGPFTEAELASAVRVKGAATA